jgi:hypothetical protein
MCFVIGILVIRLSQRGPIVNGAPLFRTFQLPENSPWGEGFTGRSFPLRWEIPYHGIDHEGCLGVLQWKGERRIG